MTVAAKFALTAAVGVMTGAGRNGKTVMGKTAVRRGQGVRKAAAAKKEAAARNGRKATVGTESRAAVRKEAVRNGREVAVRKGQAARTAAGGRVARPSRRKNRVCWRGFWAYSKRNKGFFVTFLLFQNGRNARRNTVV
jgi:hypothetical protein